MRKKTANRVLPAHVLDHIADARHALAAATELIEPVEDESFHSLSMWRIRTLNRIATADATLARLEANIRKGK